ncbi:MAG: hypothetical protein KTR31_23320 [Myxococcales bacterium]|nr:hypothetical protein [Myxococcales bacterium]
MTRTLRRLARIQRLEQDEARTALVFAERVQMEHDAELERCHERLADTLQHLPDSADELMRRHAYCLRQEMLRRRLSARSRQSEQRVLLRRGVLLEAAKQVQTTERFTDLLEERVDQDRERRDQRVLDETGLMVWMRKGVEP